MFRERAGSHRQLPSWEDWDRRGSFRNVRAHDSARRAPRNLKSKFQEQRFAEIERENRALLEKMSTIVQSRQPRSKTLPKKSLNIGLRRRELVRITLENHAFLRKLQGKHPIYSLTVEKRKRRRKQRDSASESGDSEDRWAEDRNRRGRSQYLATVPEAIKRKGSPKPPRLVYKQTLRISRRVFLVEITQHTTMLQVAAFDLESPQHFRLSLPLRDAEVIMGSPHDYERLVSHLSFQGGEMMLVERRRPIPLPKISKSLNRSIDKPPPFRFRTPHPRSHSPRDRGQRKLAHARSEEPLRRKLLDASDFPLEAFLPPVGSRLRSRRRLAKLKDDDAKTTEEVRIREDTGPSGEDLSTNDRR